MPALIGYGHRAQEMLYNQHIVNFNAQVHDVARIALSTC